MTSSHIQLWTQDKKESIQIKNKWTWGFNKYDGMNKRYEGQNACPRSPRGRDKATWGRARSKRQSLRISLS